ncbi:acyltransferase family protein [Hoeflea sp. YIM 152468]|uniref:acyltransferase family protein n=1 Tax=Hoeflea sp. YIM 152468 TaxID=3031759 RepID=UPI0023DC028C|nr:acyltransferase family protein [Hoeflea sp. YIM 152468]MDF1609361.1 acyltransferase family protein [Hoeflea sp. YIM 152468]
MSPVFRFAPHRVGWVDIAKGICILFVVMMHSTLGVEAAMGATGFLHGLTAFAKPFRMPDFFLLSGLFLGLTIERPWRLYFDRKVVHFVYFYVLWLTIQFGFKAPFTAMEQGGAVALQGYLMAFVEPFGTLWFIYILPLFFLLTRALRTLPKAWVFAWAAWLSVLPVATGWLLIDEFAARYVYFFAGYACAPLIFQAAAWVDRNRRAGLVFLALWAVVNAALVFLPLTPGLQAFAERPSELPFVGLGLGFAGALAIVSAAALLNGRTGLVARFFRHAGEHSIVVYLAFFLPMALTRTLLVSLAPGLGAGLISLLVTLAAVAGPLILYRLIGATGYGRFLFARPAWAITASRDAAAKTAPAPVA